jgi:hypothetical protein
MLLLRSPIAAAARRHAHARRCCFGARPFSSSTNMTAGGGAAPAATAAASTKAATELRDLVALDFDHTICDENSDTFIPQRALGGPIPAALKASYEPGRWTECVFLLFVYVCICCCCCLWI